ncbi:MAG: GNAT family N-acetyltransferase [Thermomicrobiales bacterium]
MGREIPASVINISGEKVGLGPMGRDQIPLYHRWLNDFDTLRTQGEPARMPDTLDGVERWYENYVLARQDVAWFTVYDLETGTPVGWTELKDIDTRHGTAEFAIMIGEPEARGKGFGSEVTRLIVEYGFNVLGLHNIHLYYLSFNMPARRAYEKAGFREYGRRSGAHRSGLERFDVVYMECLAGDIAGDPER